MNEPSKFADTANFFSAKTSSFVSVVLLNLFIVELKVSLQSVKV